MTYVFTKRTFGERINASRLARKLSQVAVARRAGIAASYLSRIESGNVHPTLGTALRIASALRMSLDDLTGPSPPQRKDRPCPVSPSGHCMMDLIDVNAELGGGDLTGFSPRQVRLVRRFTALVHRGSPNLLRALEVLVAEILEDRNNERR